MAESVYKPKPCAFHPKQMIYNFCRNQECLLPLCPTCVNVHSDEHKLQNTYGRFENIHKVVSEISATFEANLKDLEAFQEEIKQHLENKEKDETEARRKMSEARQKVIGLVERFFEDFEKEVDKSLTAFNVSMRESYHQLNIQINSMKTEIQSKISSLATEKVLKTIIGYFSKEQKKKIDNNLDVIRETLDMCGDKRVSLICQHSSIQKIIDQLSRYMYLSFQNWQNDIKYVSDFIKTGFTQTANNSINNSRINSFIK